MCKCGARFLLLFRQLFSLLRISQTSWRPSPKVGRSRTRSAWKKSGNSSSTSPRPSTPFTSCTIRCMLISITRCDGRTSIFSSARPTQFTTSLTPCSLQPDTASSRSADSSLQECVFDPLCRHTSSVCTLNHLFASSGTFSPLCCLTPERSSCRFKPCVPFCSLLEESCLKAIFMWTLQKWDNYTSSQSATNVFMPYTEETLYFCTLCRFWKKYFKVFNLLNLKCHSAQIHPTTCDCVLFIKIIINLHFLTVLPPSSIVLSYLLEVIQNPSSQSVTEAYLTCFTASWIQYLLVLFFEIQE